MGDRREYSHSDTDRSTVRSAFVTETKGSYERQVPNGRRSKLDTLERTGPAPDDDTPLDNLRHRPRSGRLEPRYR
ncbi:MAG: hypothetical protein CL477_12505 [Acidobacteria bacterium]|nr:hypothetical protein [Acidobacteriota bacterium]MDP7339007.1 hypothetical protein [Vicinamibacterales bacterium]HJN45971.1 hypothetical protein [Vicinamibacterales bacterium]